MLFTDGLLIQIMNINITPRNPRTGVSIAMSFIQITVPAFYGCIKYCGGTSSV